MPTPPKLHGGSSDTPLVADSTVEIRLRVPRSWRDELQGAAQARAIPMSNLVRILLRDFLRGRHDRPAPPGAA